MVVTSYGKKAEDLAHTVLQDVLNEYGLTKAEWETAYKYHLEKNRDIVKEIPKQPTSTNTE